MASVENGDVRIAVAALVRLVDEPQDFLRLRPAVAAAVQPGLGGRSAANRLEDLFELVRAVFHDHVRHVQHARDRPIVSLEFYDTTPGPPLREFHYILDLRAAPGVYALEVVAYRHDVAVLGGENVGELGLQAVRVLVLVHENMEKPLLQRLAHPVLGLQQLQRLDEQIVEVH